MLFMLQNIYFFRLRYLNKCYFYTLKLIVKQKVLWNR